jgi:tetratricopeptide (TPR) repeat protein
MRHYPEERGRLISFSRAATAAFTAATLRCVLAWAAAFFQENAGAGQTTNEIRVVEIQGTVETSPVASTAWFPAHTNQTLRSFDRLRTGLDSRVAFRWSDQSVISFNALTEVEVLPPDSPNSESGLHLIRGVISFFHRDEPGRIRVITRGAAAGVEGTEFLIAVNDADRTTLSVIDGVVRFGNQRGMLLLTNGQQAFADLGNPPVRTAGFIANNVLQWSFYYPAVLDPDDLVLTPAERTVLRESLDAYRTGDLLAALAKYPTAQPNYSGDERIYRAALLLSVGQVEEAEALLPSLSAAGISARTERLSGAIRQLIAAVKRQSNPPMPNPQFATEFLSQSYYEQSQAIPKVSLQAALKLASNAVSRSQNSGFAWERLSELEFSFGHNRQALDALDRSLALAPRNAQALALKGFLLASQDRVREGVDWFNRALAVDAALGNAWLGRGLCRIHRGDAPGGREDLVVAAALEPQRAELRSYLGKAYAKAGDYARANKELRLAEHLDPNDPTAWLYSALLEQQDSHINDAIGDLEESEFLNDNRRVYRSQLLLDQDRAVRSANLASVYQDAGMTETGIFEASRAVNEDYANYSAHLFLGNSYYQLIDPNNIYLRFETVAENEYLLANLLSPATAGTMSQAVSQQEYSKLFESDLPGFISETEYLSRGAWFEKAAQYGTTSDFSYNLEEDYSSDPGQRANNDSEEKGLSLTLKQQFTPRDTVYVQAIGYDATGGDLHQYYSTNMASPDFRFKETQEPTVVFGYHHEGGPGIHTLLLLARIEDTYSFTNPAQPTLVAFRPEINPVSMPGVTKLTGVDGINMHQSYKDQLAVYSGELQQIWQTADHTTIGGGRLQYGSIETENVQDLPSAIASEFPSPPLDSAQQDLKSDFNRVSLYCYHDWQIFDPLELFAGLTYDWMKFPINFQTAPVSNEEQTTSQLSPKAGLIWTPGKETTIAFAYTRSLGGASVDQSYQLEPSQVAGFVQSFRSLIPESVAAESPGARFETYGLSLEQKFSTRTYIELSAELLNSQVSEVVGAFDVLPSEQTFAVPSGLREDLDYHERTVQFTANQLLGREWSLGAQYQISRANLNDNFPGVPNGIRFVGFEPRQRTEATLQQAQLFAIYNHSSGLYFKAGALWNGQDNSGYSPNLAGDDTWQINAFAGYRFLHRRAEIRLGLLNIADQDYHLNPLNFHQEYPHQRTLTLRLRLDF